MPRLTSRLWQTVRGVSLLTAAGAAVYALSSAGACKAQQSPPHTDLPCLTSPASPGAIVLYTQNASEARASFTRANGAELTSRALGAGVLLPVYDGGSLVTKQSFGDVKVHVEFRLPPAGTATVGMRGCQIQLKDSYGATQLTSDDCGAIRDVRAPLVNASKQANRWQSMDAVFRAPQFDANGTVAANARATVYLNGVQVQNNTEAPLHASTHSAKAQADSDQVPTDTGPTAPLVLRSAYAQTEFRNIWVVPMSESPAPPARVPAAPSERIASAPPAPAAATAPDDQGASGQVETGQTGQTAEPDVRAWQSMTQGEKVPLEHGLIDQNGYRFVSTTGTTIVVPFTGNNLSVVQFGRAEGDTSYFVNAGASPVVYLSQEAYLENPAVDDARWYPLPGAFPITDPVYVAPAPNWNAYAAMGWYPGMVVYGGAWRATPVAPQAPTQGYAVVVNGETLQTWAAYRAYFRTHTGYAQSRAVRYPVQQGGPFGTGGFRAGQLRSNPPVGPGAPGQVGVQSGGGQGRGVAGRQGPGSGKVPGGTGGGKVPGGTGGGTLPAGKPGTPAAGGRFLPGQLPAQGKGAAVKKGRARKPLGQ